MYTSRGKSFVCPFFKWDGRKKNGAYVIKCERGRLELPDKAAYNFVADKFCAAKDGRSWEDCPIAIAAQKYYERTEKNEEN